jgi:histidinol-phosphate phosphatase family protein
MAQNRPIAFIDRDGTINIDEDGYIDSPDRLKLYPNAIKAIKKLNDNGWLVIIVTNQSGIGRGKFTEADIQAIHEKMKSELAKEGASVDGIYFCPHNPSSLCNCRKPKIGMIEKAMKDFGVEESYSHPIAIIGDKYIDIQLGFNMEKELNIYPTTILVKTGEGAKELAKSDTWPKKPDHVAENLMEAVDILIK